MCAVFNRYILNTKNKYILNEDDVNKLYSQQKRNLYTYTVYIF